MTVASELKRQPRCFMDQAIQDGKFVTLAVVFLEILTPLRKRPLCYSFCSVLLIKSVVKNLSVRVAAVLSS